MSVTDPISSVVAKPIKFPFLLMISFFVVVMSVTDPISSVVAKHIKFVPVFVMSVTDPNSSVARAGRKSLFLSCPQRI